MFWFSCPNPFLLFPLRNPPPLFACADKINISAKREREINKPKGTTGFIYPPVHEPRLTPSRPRLCSQRSRVATAPPHAVRTGRLPAVGSQPDGRTAETPRREVTCGARPRCHGRRDERGRKDTRSRVWPHAEGGLKSLRTVRSWSEGLKLFLGSVWWAWAWGEDKMVTWAHAWCGDHYEEGDEGWGDGWCALRFNLPGCFPFRWGNVMPLFSPLLRNLIGAQLNLFFLG